MGSQSGQIKGFHPGRHDQETAQKGHVLDMSESGSSVAIKFSFLVRCNEVCDLIKFLDLLGFYGHGKAVI